MMSSFAGEERRRSSRLAAKRPILISALDSATPRPITAFTFLLSRFGCAVRCGASFAVGAQVQVDFEGKKKIGKISFLLKSSARDDYEMGIAFDEDSSEFWGEEF